MNATLNAVTYKTAEELEAMPAEAFLNPDNFVTPYDTIRPTYAEEQYQKGLQAGREYDYITIAVNNVWSAGTYDWHRSLSSCEPIGSCAHTASLLRGFLDSGKPVFVCRSYYDCHGQLPAGQEYWFTKTNIRNGKTQYELLDDLASLL